MSSMYQHTSTRARLARVHARLRGPLRYVLIGSAIAVGFLGVLLLMQEARFGWLLVTLAVWPLLPLVWDEQALSKLPARDGPCIDDRLEVDALALLPGTLTRDALVGMFGRTKSSQFMMVRAGIGPSLIREQIDETEVAAAWQRVQEIQPSGVVSAATFFAALVYVDEALKGLLPHLQLDQHDVDAVAQWYERLMFLIKQHSQPVLSGGIARDWSFGYANTLARFGLNVSERVTHNAPLVVATEAHQGAVEYLTQIFSSGGRQNVALVGPVGTGKTTVVDAFAASLLQADTAVPASLRYHQIIKLDAAALISAASGKGQLEELINILLVEAYRAKNIILFFDDAELFFAEGVGSVDVSNLLQPVLEGGGIRIIFAMDEQRYLQLSKRAPVVAQLLNRYTLPPTSRDETMRVLQDQLIAVEFQKKVTYMYQALLESYRLSERYLYDSAQPGKALRLLTSAAQYATEGLVDAAAVRQAIEQTQGVKVGANVQSDDKERLLRLEELIHERMINQERAVSVVSDALRRARAGVRSEKRPIGTFLFLGPTGVGKTELAKALAAVYFGGEDRLVRLDMNEFVSPDDVRRLIADGVDDPHSLSAEVMKQPFSVILLDEIEKAHDTVLATLLQVLDEGVLRDIKGREVSFRDAIIIATSNAGAEHIREHVAKGDNLNQFEKAFVDELVNSGEFRPEFLNRFDEIVLFKPLTQLELSKVVGLIVSGINKTLEPQKVRVEISTELQAWLVIQGNDPRLGARPMRRIVQRVVENTLAKRLLAGEVQPGETVQLTLADIPAEFND